MNELCIFLVAMCIFSGSRNTRCILYSYVDGYDGSLLKLNDARWRTGKGQVEMRKGGGV